MSYEWVDPNDSDIYKNFYSEIKYFDDSGTLQSYFARLATGWNSEDFSGSLFAVASKNLDDILSDKLLRIPGVGNLSMSRIYSVGDIQEIDKYYSITETP